MNRTIRRIDGTLIVPRSQNQNEQETDEEYAKKLKLIIEELEFEKSEYEKFNQHLLKNAKAVYKANKILRAAIEERKAYLSKMNNRYEFSVETLEKAILKNKKISKLYTTYKLRVFILQQINQNDQYASAEMKKFQEELKDIEAKVKKLMKKYKGPHKKIRLYLILLSLIYRLDNVNSLFSHQSKNITTKPDIFGSSKKSSNFSDLQSKLKNGEEIKHELSLLNIEKTKLPETKTKATYLHNQLNRCQPIYTQVMNLVKKRNIFDDSLLQIEDGVDFDLDLCLTSPRNTANENEFKFEPGENSFTFEDEMIELRRIVAGWDFGYLKDPKRQARHKKFIEKYELIPPGTGKDSNTNDKSKGAGNDENANKNEKTNNSEKPENCEELNDLEKVKNSDESKQYGKIEISDDLDKSKKTQNSEELNDSEKSKKSQKIETIQKLKRSEKVSNSKKNHQGLLDDDIDTNELEISGLETLLSRLSQRSGNFGKADGLVDVQTSVDPLTIKEAQRDAISKSKNTYDPSIFYTPPKPLSSTWLPATTGRLSNKGNYPIRLTVTLKDIGLEGLDSATPNKAAELRKKEKERQMRIKANTFIETQKK